jgi:hypothetical protein
LEKKQFVSYNFNILNPLLIIFIGLIFFRDYLGMKIPAIIFLLLYATVALIGDKNEIIAFCICSIPLLNAFQSKYAILLCIIIYSIRFTQNIKIYLTVLPIALLMIWEFIHGFIGGSSFFETLRLFAELIFCCFLICSQTEELDFNKVARAFATTTVLVCLIILLVQLKEHSFRVGLLFRDAFRLGYGINTDRLSVGFNPNVLAFICLMAIECLCMIIYKKQSKVTDIVLITLLCVFALLTMSKKFIICGLIFLVLFVLSGGRGKNTLNILLIIAIVAVSVFFILNYFFPMVVDLIVARFEVDDITTGRIYIFNFYSKELSQNTSMLYFGMGLQGYSDKLSSVYIDASIPHNGFQELIVMWGIPGLLLFSAFLVGLVINARKKNKNIIFINYIPFIIMMIFVQAAQMVSSSVISMLFAVVYLCLVIDLKRNDKLADVKPSSKYGGNHGLFFKS